jgi:hypothetical protein
MNLTPVPDRTAEEIRVLVEDAAGRITDPIIAKDGSAASLQILVVS